MTAAPLAVVTRRDVRRGTPLVESSHRGHVVISRPDGELIGALGDPDTVVLPRSAVKPLQAAACLRALGQELPPELVAVAWASHRSEPPQQQAVRALLARAGLTPDALTCPPAVPADDPAATPHPLHHNCSGKHALFALLGAALGCPPTAVLDPDGPVQRLVLGELEQRLGPPVGLTVDGCGAPAVAVPLRRLAAAFAGLLASDDAVDVTVVRAGLRHPELVGGRGRLDTALLRVGLLAKSGAEGVFAIAGTDAAGPWGCAVKVEDGAGRAAAVAAHAIVVAAGHRPDWTPPLVSGGSQTVGAITAAAALTALGERLGTPPASGP